jgi:glycogen operon protein
MSERDDTGRPTGDDSFLLLLNAGREPVVFTLPGEPWAAPEAAYETVVDTAAAGTGEPYPRGAVVLGGRSLQLLRAPTHVG